LLAAVLLSAGQTAALNKPDSVPHFRLQVASFSDKAQAETFAVGLIKVGEAPVFDAVEIQGRGSWTRVYLGSFSTTNAARRHGDALVARGIIHDFLVKKTESIQGLTRPRTVGTRQPNAAMHNSGAEESATTKAAVAHRESVFQQPQSPKMFSVMRANRLDLGHLIPREQVGSPLPITDSAALRLGPMIDTSRVPRPDPVNLAFRLVTGDLRNTLVTAGRRRGLWLSGDIAEGLARLRWIVGEGNEGLIKVEADGRVRFDMRLLEKAAGRGETRVEDPLPAVEYISSNEGLLLLVQVAQGRHSYLLHIGRQAPTYGKTVETAGSINLDNNIDSRINPYRKNGQKLDAERPPQGFDSLIALNPVARWFNLNTNCWVHPGAIVFHELAEAYGKLEFGLDYLDQGLRPGAHAQALMREQRLKSQRPEEDIVVTNGSNRLLRTQEEIRLFTAEAIAGVNQR